MSILSQSVKFIGKAAAIMLLPLLAWSCQWVHDDYDDETTDDNATQYINITISVSADNNPVTRSPQGGEYGDGAEKGIDREYAVNDVTLIFYQDNSGINTASDDAKVLCVKKYAVRPFDESNDLPNSHSHKTGETTAGEVLYTTGKQKLSETTLEVGKTYKVLVVANADVAINVGDKIKDIRDKVLGSIYTGTGKGTDAASFVMTSESDATVELKNPTIETEANENRFIYYFNCIHMERLAARIDFLASGATYSADTYDHNGCVYNVTGSTTDKFVLTSIQLFNINDGNEYLFKRTNDATNPYLADETTTNWVVDPNTALKTAAAHPAYITSTLTSVAASGTFDVTMSGQQSNKLAISGSDDIIIGYAKENTITASTPYYYYATGLAFEGYYYKNGATTGGQRRVYYHFIRHQGEKETAYDAMTATDLEDFDKNSTIGNNGTPMNFGIVRNNIYRIQIGSIKADEDDEVKVTLHIKVKKWDLFEHDTIYM